MNIIENKLKIGGHMSIAQGIQYSIDKGESIGCSAIQIFTKSNRQWKSKALDQTDIIKFQEKLAKSSIKEVVVHASYLINIGSPDLALNQKSVIALEDELNRCHQLGLKYLILHPGNRQDSTTEECLNLIAKNINYLFKKNKTNVVILLENTAGMGLSVGSNLNDLSHILDKIENKERIGICIDTCHAFAAGYDIKNENSYNKFWQEFDKAIGLNKLKAIHLNDSKKELGSKLDRHEFIGKGKIGLEAFKLILNDQKIMHVPKILETPIDTIEDYIPDFITTVNLIDSKNRHIIYNTPLEKYLK